MSFLSNVNACQETVNGLSTFVGGIESNLSGAWEGTAYNKFVSEMSEIKSIISKLSEDLTIYNAVAILAEALELIIERLEKLKKRQMSLKEADSTLDSEIINLETEKSKKILEAKELLNSITNVNVENNQSTFTPSINNDFNNVGISANNNLTNDNETGNNENPAIEKANNIINANVVEDTKGMFTYKLIETEARLEALKEMAYFAMNNGWAYGSYYSTTPFVTKKVRTDCTGFAGAYMAYVAGADSFKESWSGEMIDRNSEYANQVKEYGWKAYSSNEIDSLLPGDVLVSNKHAEIYVDETHTFGWGSVKSSYPSNRPVTKSKDKNGKTIYQDLVGTSNQNNYVTIYRYEG